MYTKISKKVLNSITSNNFSDKDFKNFNLYLLYLDTLQAGGIINVKHIRTKKYYRSKEVHDFLNHIGNRDFTIMDIINFDKSAITNFSPTMQILEKRCVISILPYSKGILFQNSPSYIARYDLPDEDLVFLNRTTKQVKPEISFFERRRLLDNITSNFDYTMSWVIYTPIDTTTVWIDSVETDLFKNIDNPTFLSDIKQLLEVTLEKFIYELLNKYKQKRIIIPSTEVYREFYGKKEMEPKYLNIQNSKQFHISDTNTENILLPNSTRSYKLSVLSV